MIHIRKTMRYRSSRKICMFIHSSYYRHVLYVKCNKSVLLLHSSVLVISEALEQDESLQILVLDDHTA
jgi:hypothetical protein